MRDRRTLLFVTTTYLLFFLAIGLIGAAMLLLNAPPVVVESLKLVSSWTPTLALLVLFPRLVPTGKRWSFVRGQFSARMDRRTLIMSIVPMTTVLIGTIATVGFVSGEAVPELVLFSPIPLLLMGLYQLPFGPAGEELGWRAFLLPHLQQRYSFLKGTLLTGLAWSFWHTPLWLLSGYQGTELVVYVVSFMVAIMCCNFMIAYMFDACRNLLIPVLIHFLNNFFLQLLTFELVPGLAYFAASYLVVTAVFVVVEEPRRRARQESPDRHGCSADEPGPPAAQRVGKT